MLTISSLKKPETDRPPVQCECGHKIFDGEVIRSRCVKLTEAPGQALCRCKRWVAVPVVYQPM